MARTSKRARIQASLEMPTIGMRLCVGDRAVPLKSLAFTDAGRDSAITDFVLLTSRAADLSWLESALGLPRRSFVFEAKSKPLAAEFLGQLHERLHARTGY